MAASTTSWADMQAEHQSIAEQLSSPPQSMNNAQQARQDIVNLTRHGIYASKLKTVPQGSLPLEILVMLLAPNYIRKTQQAGLHTTEELSTTNTSTTPTFHFLPGPTVPSATGCPEPKTKKYKAQKLRTTHTPTERTPQNRKVTITEQKGHHYPGANLKELASTSTTTNQGHLGHD